MLRLACALLLVTQVASADDPRKDQSRAAFRKGVELAQKGNYPEARDQFAEAYRLFPHPSILLNLGLMRAKTGDYLDAEQDLVHFLADDGGASREEIQSARTALSDARTHIGTLRLKVGTPGAHASIDGKSIALAAGEQTEERILAGKHKLEIGADGYKTEVLDVTGDPRQPTVVELSLAVADKPLPPPGEKSIAGTAIGVSLLAAGGVTLLVGIGCGARAIVLANGYNDRSSDDFQKPNIKSDGLTFRTASDVMLVTSIVLAGVGIGVLLWPSPKAQVTAGPGFVTLTGRF